MIASGGVMKQACEWEMGQQASTTPRVAVKNTHMA